MKCHRCGACCKVFGIIESEEVDDPNLTMDEGLGYRTMKVEKDGTCICLNTLSGQCNIYKKRPLICKKFSPGGFWCKYARSKIGYEMS